MGNAMRVFFCDWSRNTNARSYLVLWSLSNGDLSSYNVLFGFNDNCLIEIRHFSSDFVRAQFPLPTYIKIELQNGYRSAVSIYVWTEISFTAFHLISFFGFPRCRPVIDQQRQLISSHTYKKLISMLMQNTWKLYKPYHGGDHLKV